MSTRLMTAGVFYVSHNFGVSARKAIHDQIGTYVLRTIKGASLLLGSALLLYFIVVIPLTHHKNSGYTELKVLGVYFSPAAVGGKITANCIQFPI